MATAVAVWNFNSALPKLFSKHPGLFSFGEGCLVLQAASVCVAKAFLCLTEDTVNSDDNCKVKAVEETMMVGLLVLCQLPRPLRHISVMSNYSCKSPLSIKLVSISNDNFRHRLGTSSIVGQIVVSVQCS